MRSSVGSSPSFRSNSDQLDSTASILLPTTTSIDEYLFPSVSDPQAYTRQSMRYRLAPTGSHGCDLRYHFIYVFFYLVLLRCIGGECSMIRIIFFPAPFSRCMWQRNFGMTFVLYFHLFLYDLDYWSKQLLLTTQIRRH